MREPRGGAALSSDDPKPARLGGLYDTRPAIPSERSCHRVRRFKKDLCKYFERGHCDKGAQCTFAHGYEELRDGGNKVAGRLQFAVLEGMPASSPDSSMERFVKTFWCCDCVAGSLQQRFLRPPWSFLGGRPSACGPGSLDAEGPTVTVLSTLVQTRGGSRKKCCHACHCEGFCTVDS